MKKKRKIYLNKGQMYMRAMAPKHLRVLASRRFGKSDGTFGQTLSRDVHHMPRGAGAIYQRNYKQLLSRTIPSTLQFFDRLGYIEGLHYFVGKKAPAYMGFENPYIMPRGGAGWENVMHWWNGAITHMLSQDVKFAANSLTLDYWKADEGRSLKKEKLWEELVPAVSGTPGKFKDVPWHRGSLIVSDMPTGKEGMWLLDMKKEAETEENKDLIRMVETLLFERNKITQKYGKDLSQFPQAKLKFAQLTNEMNVYRSHMTMFLEYDTIENLEILGEEYILEQKRILPPVIFYTSIMNKLIRKLKGGFYANLDEDLHYYDAADISFIRNQRTKDDSLDYRRIAKLNDCRQDADIDPNQHLSIALDYNANINWIATGQRGKRRMRTLSSMFTKHENKVRQVVRNWIKYYKPHLKENSTVVYYYTQQALDGGYADEAGQNWKEIVIEELNKADLWVIDVYMGAQWNQRKKHQVINDALRGEPGLLFPTFNRDNNEYLLPAMEQAGVKVGYRGFEKDKSGEKLAETEDDPLELRTDGTDAWDDLYRGLQYFPQELSISVPVSRFSGQ